MSSGAPDSQQHLEFPLAERVAQWNASALVVLRAAGLALAAVLAGSVGAFALALPPWAAMALPAGLVIAALRRWGPASAGGALFGAWLALLLNAVPPLQAGGATLALGAGAWLTLQALAWLNFDGRLERPNDIAALIGASALAFGLPVAAVMSVVAPPAGSRDTVSAFFAGWVVLADGALAAAVLLFAVDRSAVLSLQIGAPLRKAATSVAALAAVAWLLWLAPGAAPAVAALAFFAPLVLVCMLALREQLALAATALLLCGLLAATQAGGGTPVLAAWFTTALALMLMAHGSTMQWRSRSQRWEWALDGSRMGVADWHLQMDDSFASAAWRTLSGHSTRDWSPEAWLAEVHPDDRPALQHAIAKLSTGEVGRAEAEVRIPTPAGWRWAEATLMVIEREIGGHPLRLLATLADVQDRRDAMERQRMSASLFQHLHEGLLITDPDLRVLDANPAYTQILGVPRDELLGTVPSLLRPTPADPVARQQRAAMWASLRDQGSWRGELMERRRNGETCVLQTTISTVYGPAMGGEGTLRGVKTGEPTLRYHVLVISDITEQRNQRDRLERQAHTDELTRLPNRTRLSQLLDDALRAADRDGYLLVVCYLDLDRFKPVNDKLGHAAGDRLLSELAGRLRGALRSREQWTDCAARLGGDEFVLLLRAGTLDEARLAVERVLRVVSQPYVVETSHDAVQITASMGATVYPIDRSDADTLLRHADHAMYGAKQSGRNGYQFFDPEQRRRTEQRNQFIDRLQIALEQQEFVLHYQPKVDMRSGRVLGFEALLRWEHPERGLVAPLQFLPQIESEGLSSRIGDWVIARALENLQSWRRNGFDFSVSVNVSARHLQEPDFALRLAELLARHHEPLARYLEIEMLETAAHADIEATSALLARCQGIGVRFALDDFGTGYSTLTYLKRLPVDVLKIDRSFVHQMLDDAQDRAIVEGVIGLARTFGCTVVAEGVESPAQARMLLELGCDIGQGTGIAAPMLASQVAGWVREYKGMFALAPALGAGAEPAADGSVGRLGG